MQTTSLTDLILLSTDKSLLPRVKHTLWVLITHAFPGVERKKVKSINIYKQIREQQIRVEPLNPKETNEHTSNILKVGHVRDIAVSQSEITFSR